MLDEFLFLLRFRIILMLNNVKLILISSDIVLFLLGVITFYF